MATPTKNFTEFNTAAPLLTSDYIVGYNAAGTAEIKTQVQSILNLKSDLDSQTLSFNETNKNLSITSGNTVSLSTFATNTDFNSYKTNVASATSTLLPTTTYQSASGNWQNTFTNTQSNSANWNFGYGVATFVQANSANWEESQDITAITTTVASNSSNWNNAYNTATAYQANSATYASNSIVNSVSSQLVLNTDFNSYKTDVASATASNINYVHTNFLPLTGGIISGETRINNNLTIWGNLSASGTQTFANTVFSTTSALSVVHVGSGPAMWVGNNGDGDIASFYDIDGNIEVLHVGGNTGTFPNVGIKTSAPNKTLTVAGEISANNTIYDNVGNSTQWNRAYNVATFVENSSASNIVTQGNARGANISIGTNDGYHLRLKTNSSAKFTVLSSGEVGIGTTLAQTKPGSQLSQVLNGSFTDTTGMDFNDSDWYGGTVPNWLGPTDEAFTVYFNGGNYYRNIGTGTAPGASSARQSLGVLPVRSNIILTFTNSSVPFGSATLSAAIYNNTFTAYASGSFDGLGTYTLSAANVPADNSITVGFWGSAGITNISVTTINSDPYLTVNGSISAKELIQDSTGNSKQWNRAYNVATTYQTASSSFATNTLLQSTSTLLTPLTLTNTLTGQLVLNTDFDSYKTNVANTTATLLPTSIYQSASSNWESTYSTFSTTSAVSIVAGGNTRTANIIIGTNDAYHLRFETNNNAKMTILSSGEVGIGTTIAQTRSPVISTIANGDFQDTTDLTLIEGSVNWYYGNPYRWTSPNNISFYSVWKNTGESDLVVNSAAVATGPGLSSFRQNLGTLQVISDINLTFDYASTSIASWSSGTLSVAIYDGSFNVLATNTYTTAGTYSLIATAVPAGTTIIVGFWATTANPGINNVTVTQVTSTSLTVVGGVSASSIVTPRLQVREGIVVFSNLPTLSANLPVGALWNNSGTLRIV